MILQILTNYEPNVRALILLINALNVKVSNTSINETLKNHPNYPSLLSLSDSLNHWGVENIGAHIESDKLAELETPFLAHITNGTEESFILIQDVEENFIRYRKNPNSKKVITKSKTDFLKEWTGVVLLASADESSGEKDFLKTRKREIKKDLTLVGLLCLFLFGSILTVARISENGFADKKILISYSILLFLKIIGTIITILLLWYEVDQANPLLQKICTGFSKANCNAILSSKQAKFLNLISWSEVGFSYFAGGLLILLFANQSVIAITAIITLLSFFALPYVFFSIYYQWRVVKQWCLLCIFVQAILILEVLTALAFSPFSNISLQPLSLYFFVLIAFITPLLLWFLLKPILIKSQQSKQHERDLLRLKADKEIFTIYSEKQKAITYSTDGLGIILGNPNATNTLVKVCNPYCKPCANAHPEIETLLRNHSNLKIQIIFTARNDETDLSLLPVKHLMALNEKKDKLTTEKALDDWYLSPEKNYGRFAAQYPMNGELDKQALSVEAMYKWCRAMDITFTPTFFFNGYQLPDIYNISELKNILVEN